MAIMFSRDANGWHIDDTTNPEASRTFPNEHEFNHHVLVLLVESFARIEQALADLQRSFNRGTPAEELASADEIPETS